MKFSPNPQAMDIVGVGFRPTEEELVDFYLKHMLLADDPRVNIIPVIDLCDVEPWDVPRILAKSAIPFGNPEWFFFSPVDFKYSNSRRVNRRTKLGFWKPTGADRKVKTWETNTVIGSKKTLVYYQGRVSSGVKSFWVIHEYHALTLHQTKRNFVLCRLMKKHQRTNKGVTDALICDKEKQSKSMISVFENLTTAEEIPSEGTFNGMETIFQETPQAEKYFSPVQQCATGIEQEETLFPNYPFNNAYFKNESNITQTSFETREKDEFLNSNLMDKYLFPEKQYPNSIEKDETSLSNYSFNYVYFRNENKNNTIQTSFETTKEDQFLNSILANERCIFRNENKNNTIQNSFETTKEDQFLNSILANERCVFRNENKNNTIQTSFETTKEDKFLNSILADERCMSDEESESIKDIL